jgi:hypothetical protein
MPGAVLRFRDRAGRIIATITANNRGEFRRSGLSHLSQKATINGFGLFRETYNTGSPMRFYFSPLGIQTASSITGMTRPSPAL